MIGNPLRLSPDFPPLHTVRDSFPSYGVPSIYSLLDNNCVIWLNALDFLFGWARFAARPTIVRLTHVFHELICYCVLPY